MDVRSFCLGAVDWLFPPQCGVCERVGSGLCAQCFQPGDPISFHTKTLGGLAIGPYAGSLKAAVLALKRGRRDVAASLGALLRPHIGSHELLVPVPTTDERRAERGFDGALTLARAAACDPASIVAVLRQNSGDAQRGRSRLERLAASGRFLCVAPERVRDQTLTLVDDVVTTGATLEDCATVLRASGARVERAIVVARADVLKE